MNKRLALALPALLLGCSTSLSATQTAKVVAPGHVEMAASASIPVPTQVVAELIDLAGDQADRLRGAEQAGRPLTEEEQRQALEAGLGLALFTPGVVTEVSARTGLAPRLEAGLRLAPSLGELELKYQLLEAERAGVDLSVGASYGYHFGYGSSLLKGTYGLLDFVQLSDYSRHDLQASLFVSREWDEIIAVYGAVHYLASFVSLDADLLRLEAASGAPHTDLDSRLHYLGGTAGLMLGYRYLFANLELSVVRVFARPTVLGAERDLGGFIVAPTLGLVARF